MASHGQGAEHEPPADAWIEGGDVTSPRGFRAAGVASGIKREGLDLALLASDGEAGAAGMFTSNRVRAAPVRWCERVLASARARAIVANSGNANACTGEAGERAAAAMARLTAEALGADPERILVASTGVIGHPLPLAPLERGIPAAAAALDRDGDAAARAILTTDTRPKAAALAVEIAGRAITLGGMAKGAGMIGPDLRLPHATTLAFLTTDAPLAAVALRAALRAAIDVSFNAITVDGDTSTNDTVLLLANGAAGGAELSAPDELATFRGALTVLARRLALDVVRDGEGATRLIRIDVAGARDAADAKRVALTVANSPLVKTAFSAGEPNWGRILMAVGRAGAAIDPDRVSVRIGGLSIVERGVGAGTDPETLRAAMSRPEAEVAIDLGIGAGSFTVWTCDLSEEYVRINAHYLT
ncbi:MAG TPA: bifunctional glutamate N-acetyltransferase/amino-acid acetyltransferase ArgJ [Thermoanaerobaculia bacterium]|nr:bifunctional glutamate N-acetyltransferase/amino-acid acetyltransferase ArgJ [Thermoanaerobaculia bacterium]